MGQYNGKWPFSLVYVLKPLITVKRAIELDTVWEDFTASLVYSESFYYNTIDVR